jgi:hypothetical protein
MHAFFRWLSPGVLCVVGASGALAQPAPAEVETALPHIARISGTGATVQRDTEEVEALTGEHLAFGDRVASGDAQVQLVWSDGSLVSLDRHSAVTALGPDLLTFPAGRLIVTTPRLGSGSLRVDTPAGSLRLAVPGDYRLTAEGEVTTVGVVHGQADVSHMDRDVTILAGQTLTFRDGLAPGTPTAFNTAGLDTFALWASEPVAARDRSPSLAYLDDPRLEAYTDVFDRHGQWDSDPTYGQVWFPAVGADWRPFSQGYWQPFGGAYGMTWVGQDPWGWPTHHFGQWGMHPGGRWFWRPGQRWSPGRVSWSVGPGMIGWSPLGLQGDAWAWGALANPALRGVHRGGTLDPFRAWTVVPRNQFGRRGGVWPHALDARTLTNLNAFVTQRVAPPFGHWGGVGMAPGWPVAGPGGAGFGVGGVGLGPGAGFGPGFGFGWGPPPVYGPRVGADTTGALRRGVGPTFVDPPVPGPMLGVPGASQPPDDPYERARQQMTPRTRQRAPQDTDRPRTAPPTRQPQAQPPSAGEPPPGAAQRPAREWSAGERRARPAAGTTAPPSRGVAVPRSGGRTGADATPTAPRSGSPTVRTPRSNAPRTGVGPSGARSGRSAPARGSSGRTGGRGRG